MSDSKRTALGERILEIFEEKGTNINRFCKDIGCSRTKIYQLLEKEEISLKDATFLCTLLGIGPERLGLPADYFKTPYNTQSKSNEIEIHSYNAFSQRTADSNKRTFIKQYFDLFANYITSQMQHSVVILDYCAKEKGLENKFDSEYYHDLNTQFYADLENRFDTLKASAKPFEYERFMQLPLDVERYSEVKKKFFSHRRKLPFDISVRIIIELMFEETFKHIWNCYRSFDEEFSLNVLKLPIRFYNVYITDGQSIISEFDKCNIDREIFPDLIFAESVNSVKPDSTFVKDLIQTYEIDLEKLKLSKKNKGEHLKVSKELFIHCLQEQQKYIEDSINELDLEIDELQSSLKTKQGNKPLGEFLKKKKVKSKYDDLNQMRDELQYWIRRKKSFSLKVAYFNENS